MVQLRYLQSVLFLAVAIKESVQQNADGFGRASSNSTISSAVESSTGSSSLVSSSSGTSSSASVESSSASSSGVTSSVSSTSHSTRGTTSRSSTSAAETSLTSISSSSRSASSSTSSSSSERSSSSASSGSSQTSSGSSSDSSSSSSSSSSSRSSSSEASITSSESSSSSEPSSSSGLASSTEFSTSTTSSDTASQSPTTTDAPSQSADQSAYSASQIVTRTVNGKTILSNHYTTITQSAESTASAGSRNTDGKGLSKKNRNVVIGCVVGIGVPLLLILCGFFYFYCVKAKKTNFIDSEGHVVTAYRQNKLTRWWYSVMGKDVSNEYDGDTPIGGASEINNENSGHRSNGVSRNPTDGNGSHSNELMLDEEKYYDENGNELNARRY